jgi:RNA polymerase sigma-70 factor (ECF subfamily)
VSSQDAFEQHRSRLLRLAQRMLGTRHEAEDVLQDAFVRWHEADAESVRVPEAFLVTTVTRLALDRLRRTKTERAAYVGQWLPEPWMHGALASEGPDLREERADQLSYAAQVLLSQLSPEERAAFLLREVFDLDYAQVAAALERNEAATRKLVQRAHAHLADNKPRNEASVAEQHDLLARFKAACEAIDSSALTALLSPSAAYTTDGGGKEFAARDVLLGSARIVRVHMTVARKAPENEQHRLVNLDGEPALVTLRAGAVYALTFIAVEAGVIRDIYKILNPDKLAQVSALLARGAS